MGEFAIEAEGAGHRYGRRWALIDAGFQLGRGRVAIVAGRNGSGKSTLLRLLAGAIRLDLGRVTIEGIDLQADRISIRRQVALLSHAAYTYEQLTALENARLWAELLEAPHDRASLVTILERVGLASRGDDPVSDFSAGMRKRLSIARVLMQAEPPQDAPVVLLDEPFGQLDPPGFLLIEKVISDLRERGKSLLVATHQIERMASIADDAIVLEAGRVAWSGAARELPSRAGAIE
jgi:heme exporter protein A